MSEHEVATVAGGCFWCTEAVFQRLKGVVKVVPGYTGGAKENPSYQQVSSGTTGHAEAVQITFEPSIISFEKLLEVFWRLHDPTTLNRQGADVGTQYRSAIFYHTEEQKRIAQASKEEADKAGFYPRPIVTEIAPCTKFYEAESYHENFYNENPDYPYCRIVIDPKIQKLMKDYKEELKETQIKS